MSYAFCTGCNSQSWLLKSHNNWQVCMSSRKVFGRQMALSLAYKTNKIQKLKSYLNTRKCIMFLYQSGWCTSINSRAISTRWNYDENLVCWMDHLHFNCIQIEKLAKFLSNKKATEITTIENLNELERKKWFYIESHFLFITEKSIYSRKEGKTICQTHKDHILSIVSSFQNICKSYWINGIKVE